MFTFGGHRFFSLSFVSCRNKPGTPPEDQICPKKKGVGIGEEEDDLRRDEGNKKRRIVGRRLGQKQGSLVFLG